MNNNFEFTLAMHKAGFITRFTGVVHTELYYIPALGKYRLTITTDGLNFKEVIGSLKKCDSTMNKYLKQYNLVSQWNEYKNNI